MRRIVVNLAPADLKKEGPAYDLPIAIGILLSSEQIKADVSSTLFLGELSLDGTLRHTSGILPMVAMAREMGLTNIIVPEADAREAALISGVNIVPLASLGQCFLPERQIYTCCSGKGRRGITRKYLCRR
jgi:magnesium chelatase family protein